MRPTGVASEAKGAAVNVSVVVPVHDAEGVLGAQLAALRDQSFSDPFEVIVVLNRCTDSSEAVARHFADQFEHLRIVEASSQAGASYARNVGSRHAAGSLLLYCDADDVVGPNWVQGMVDALADADLVGGHMDVLLDGAVVRGVGGAPNSGGLMNCNSVLVAASCSLACTREVMDRAGGWDEDYRHGCDDIVFCIQAQRHGFRIGFSRTAVASYRHRPTFLAAVQQRASYGRGDALFIRREQPWLYHGAPFAVTSALFQVMHIMRPSSSGLRAKRALNAHRTVSKTWALLRDPPPRHLRSAGLMRRAAQGVHTMRTSPTVDFTAPLDYPVIGGYGFLAPLHQAAVLAADASQAGLARLFEAVVPSHTRMCFQVTSLDLLTLVVFKQLGKSAQLDVVVADSDVAQLLQLNVDRHAAEKNVVIRHSVTGFGSADVRDCGVIRIAAAGREPDALSFVLRGHGKVSTLPWLFIDFDPSRLRAEGHDPVRFAERLCALGEAVACSHSGNPGLLADYAERLATGGVGENTDPCTAVIPPAGGMTACEVLTLLDGAVR